MNNLAIIPARGGSKTIPKKNLKNIAGVPLIAWTINSALVSKNINKIVVSTDDENRAEVSEKYGAEVPFIRPEELATDEAPTEIAIMHAINFVKNEQNYKPDNIILLQCTSPVRNPFSIDKAIEEFTNKKADSLLSVCEYKHFLWKNLNHLEADYDYQNRPRRQDITKDKLKFKENGSIYITNCEKFIEHKNRLCGRMVAFQMTEEESFEIDTELDWLLVEAILTSREKK